MRKLSNFSSPVTIQDRNGRCCSQANPWRASRDTHMSTRWFLWFWVRACSTHTPNFLTLSIECKCHTMVEWSQFITFASSRVHWRGWLWINALNDLYHTRNVFLERGVLLMSKWTSFKRKNYFLPCSLRWHCPHTRCKCFWPPPLLSPLYWTQREQYVRNVPISPIGIPFYSVHGSTHHLQMTKLQYVNSCRTVELQIKNYNR